MNLKTLTDKLFDTDSGVFTRLSKVETNQKWHLFIMSGIFALNIAILGGIISIFVTLSK